MFYMWIDSKYSYSGMVFISSTPHPRSKPESGTPPKLGLVVESGMRSRKTGNKA